MYTNGVWYNAVWLACCTNGTCCTLLNGSWLIADWKISPALDGLLVRNGRLIIALGGITTTDPIAARTTSELRHWQGTCRSHRAVCVRPNHCFPDCWQSVALIALVETGVHTGTIVNAILLLPPRRYCWLSPSGFLVWRWVQTTPASLQAQRGLCNH